ncbi:MAG: O-antigen ligase family protein [Chloroflexi bacterium]|nr:O-antigen ligase family protein [Chloroflexota bacterium]
MADRGLGGPRLRAAGELIQSSLIRRAIVWVVALKIVGLVLVFDWSLRSIQGIELPKSIWSRTTAFVLLALIGMLLFRYGRAALPRSVWHIPAVAYVIVVALSALVAENRYLAIFGDARYLGLVFTIDMFILYLAVTIAVRGRSDALILVGALTACGAAACVYALVQYVGLDPIKWGDDPRGRPFATLGNPDSFGHLVSVLVAVALALTVFASGRIRLAAALFGTVALAVGVLVATRGTALALLALLIVLPLAIIRVHGITALRTRRAVVLGGCTLVVIAILVVVTPLGRRVRDTVTAAQPGGDRVIVYRAALDAFADRPLLGYGPDGFAAAFTLNRPPESARVLGPGVGSDTAHSWLLQALATTGALGTLTLIAFAVSGTLLAVRQVQARWPVAALAIVFGCVAYWAHGIVSIGSLGIDWWPWLANGVAVGLSAPVSTVAPVRFAPRALALAPLSLAIAAGAFGMNELYASWDARLSLAAGDTPTKITSARSAVARDPGRAEHWNTLGLASFYEGEYRSAADAFQRAADRSPYVQQYWSNLALMRIRTYVPGDARTAQPALDAARRAVSADPNDTEAHETLALVAMRVGDPRLAIAELERARELYPVGLSYFSDLSRAYEAAGDRATAIALQEKVVAAQGSDEDRLRLAALYWASGDMTNATRLVRPPSIRSADTNCSAVNGMVSYSAGYSVPRCIRVNFASEVTLTADGPASVLRVDNYVLDGRALTRAEFGYDGRNTVVIQLPLEGPVPIPGLRLVVRGVTNIYGQPLSVDTAPVTR